MSRRLFCTGAVFLILFLGALQPGWATTPTPTVTPTVPPTAACYPAWNPATAYAPASLVSRQGYNYQAIAASFNQDPANYTGFPWQVLGSCLGPTVGPTPRFTPTPVSPTPTARPEACGSEWVVATMYQTGDVVSQRGSNYRANYTQAGYDPYYYNGPGMPWLLVAPCIPPTPTVTPTPTPTQYDAVFTSVRVPSTMLIGGKYPVSLTVKNLGPRAWTVDDNTCQILLYKVGSGQTEAVTYVNLPGPVGVGEEVTLNFMHEARGSGVLAWQMWQTCAGWGYFGTASPNASSTILPAAAHAARFVSQTVPTTMVAGQTYGVSLKVRNMGLQAWNDLGTSCNSYHLGSAGPQDNLLWGRNRASLPATVGSDGEATIAFTVTAPATPGTYNFRWRMLQECVEWFGDVSPNVAVTVRSAAGARDAQVLTQNVPDTMVAGQTYSINMRVKNVGTQAWDPVGPGCNSYRLGVANPAGNSTWTTKRAELPTTLAPGQAATLSFDVTAPTTPGTYNFQWRMLQECVAWFGEPSPNVAVAVRAQGAQDAQFLSQSVPSDFNSGEHPVVSLKVKNVGTVGWSPVGSGCTAYALGSVNPADKPTWPLSRAPLAGPVAPGQEVTLSFSIGNNSVGTYNFQWRMLQECIGAFGDSSASRLITVF